MSKYRVALEVAGPAAIFCSTEHWATPASYPVSIWSADKTT
jgi:hypothetical protein